MQPIEINNPASPHPTFIELGDNQSPNFLELGGGPSSTFIELLGRQEPIALIDDPLAQAQHAKAQANDPRKVAEQWVSTVLIKPLLAELRDEPLSSDFLDGGFSEDVFSQQLDTILADRITTKSNFSVVDAVYRKLTAHAAQRVDTHG